MFFISIIPTIQPIPTSGKKELPLSQTDKAFSLGETEEGDMLFLLELRGKTAQQLALSSLSKTEPLPDTWPED